MTGRYLKEKELAELIRRSVHTLRRDRFEGRGFPYIKLRGQVLYPVDRVERYLQDHLVQPEEARKNDVT